MALIKIKYVTVEPVLFLYMFATLLQYIAVQDMAYRRVCLAEFDPHICDQLGSHHEERHHVQGATMYLILVSTIGMTVPTLISVGYIGSWSDKYGRKVPLIFPCIGNALAGMVYMAIDYWHDMLPIELIILSSVISGIFGGFVATVMAVMSYMASISDPESRTMRVSILESMSYLGGTSGLFLGSFILSNGGHFTVFLVFTLCNVLATIYTVLCVSNVADTEPEKDKAVNSAVSGYFAPQHLWGSFKTCFASRKDHGRRNLLCLTSAAFLIFLTTAGEADISYVFVKDAPLAWDQTQYSYYFGLKFFLNAVALFALLPLVRWLWSPSDTAIAIVSILSKTAGLVLFGMSTSSVMVYSVCFVSMLSSWSTSVLRSMLSKTVEAHEEGRMFALIAALEVICVLAGALLFAGLYAVLRVMNRGLIFFVASGLLLISLLIFIYLHCVLERPRKVPEDDQRTPVGRNGCCSTVEEATQSAVSCHA